MSAFFLIFFIITAVFIWLETTAFVEYARLFGLKPLHQGYDDKLKMIPSLTYSDYLLLAHNNFFTRLITCSDCLIVWLNIFLFSDRIRLLCVGIVFSWVGFYFLKFIKRKANE